MIAQKHPWIPRKVADEIYARIVTADNAPVTYLIQAPAGIGKTYLARDIGVRLGSPTGYEPAQQGNVAWSGILDVYDPDTNSNQGIERRLMEAFSQTGFEFEAYREARTMYDIWFKGGIVGSSLEEQRRKVEVAFAEGLKAAAAQQLLVMAFDTIERLESALDPLQQTYPESDTASVIDWLIFQITQLEKGAVLLLGRQTSHFYQKLCAALEKAGRPAPELLDLGALDADEAQDFFTDRAQRYPQAARLLDEDLKALLLERTTGNPLLLDLALLSLVESQNPRSVRQALEGQDNLREVEKALLSAYMNAFDKSERQTLLRHLAVARNGLFAELLQVLEPAHTTALLAELEQMGALPFVKMRNISVNVPEQETRIPRRTYFLHDAMYALCDEVWLTPEEVKHVSQRLLDWYNTQIEKSPKDNDLLVDSLFYRMRADPVGGYQWYLQQADQAIRSAHTGLDMRLRDAMGLFLVSASSDSSVDPGQSLSSRIDRDNVAALMPEIFDDFRLDSAILWMKRYMIRGKTNLAVAIGVDELPGAENLSQRDRSRYCLAFAEFLLWYGQATMYAYQIDEALKLYDRVIGLVKEFYPDLASEEILTKLSDFERWRLSLVLGRTYNNLGYSRWMYKGQYHLALQDFQQAVRLFRMAGLEIKSLEEELANTNDNMGRVYAVVGSEFQAVQLIRRGLEMRKSLELTYRVALSTNSLALALNRFGRVEQALKTVDAALIPFRRTEVARGIGLGLLTRGMVYRNMAEMYDELSIPVQDALKYAESAETDLREAMRYFSTVDEPIRRVQVLNEMACCHRSRYLLLRHSKAPKNEQDMAFIQGRTYFRQAIELARQQNYTIDELDSMQDLAVLLTRARIYDEADKYLKDIRAKIPNQYVIQPGRGLGPIPPEECVDAFYKLLGQVELLEGAIVYERGKLQAVGCAASDDELERAQPTHEAWLETARHYLLAVSYFDHYATETFVRSLTFARIYKRFEKCAPTLVRDIREHMSQQAEAYRLSPELVRDLFRDVFGLFEL